MRGFTYHCGNLFVFSQHLALPSATQITPFSFEKSTLHICSHDMQVGGVAFTRRWWVPIAFEWRYFFPLPPVIDLGVGMCIKHTETRYWARKLPLSLMDVTTGTTSLQRAGVDEDVWPGTLQPLLRDESFWPASPTQMRSDTQRWVPQASTNSASNSGAKAPLTLEGKCANRCAHFFLQLS